MASSAQGLQDSGRPRLSRKPCLSSNRRSHLGEDVSEEGKQKPGTGGDVRAGVSMREGLFHLAEMLKGMICNLPVFEAVCFKGCLPRLDLREMCICSSWEGHLSVLHFRQLYQESSFNNVVALSYDLLGCGINT